MDIPYGGFSLVKYPKLGVPVEGRKSCAINNGFRRGLACSAAAWVPWYICD